MLADLAVLTLLASMVLTAAMAWRGSRIAALALAMQSLAWLSVNKVAEGPVLVDLGEDHGLAMADLVTVLGLIFAAVSFVWSSRDQEPSDSRPSGRTTWRESMITPWGVSWGRGR